MSKYQYDFAVIGAGAAGLVASKSAVRLGLKVALIEKERTGGDCTWAGCVPSKALLAAAKVAHTASDGARYGVHIQGISINFAEVMQHVRQTILDIYAEETPDVLREESIDVYETTARFIDPHTLEFADGKRITANKFAICTGSTPFVPDAFRNVPHLTNKTLFGLQIQPQHLIILGGGPVGTEMAQAFQRLGTQVTVIDQESRLLPRDDEEASQLIMDVLRKEGVELRLGTAATKAEGQNGAVTVHLADSTTITGDTLLIALGRRPHVDSLNLSAAGVEVDQQSKLILKDTLQTSQSHIYAAGDVTGGLQFTHLAGSQGFTVFRNLFFPLTSKAVTSNVPWTTFTDPEIGHVGLTEAQARTEHGNNIEITRLPMTRNDRAMTEGKSTGFMKLVHLKNGKLLGATIVGLNAGDLVNEWAHIIKAGGKIRGAAGKMRIYPTHNNANGTLATENFKRSIKHGLTGKLLRLAVGILNR